MTVNRELAAKAAEAWAMMTRPVTIFTQIAGEQPMPAAVALDFVQNVTGERDEAVTALVNAGADWLDAQTRPSETGEIANGCMQDAVRVTKYLRGQYFGYANAFLSHIQDRCNQAADPRAAQGEKWAANSWLGWARKASAVIEACRRVVEAAYPTE